MFNLNRQLIVLIAAVSMFFVGTITGVTINHLREDSINNSDFPAVAINNGQSDFFNNYLKTVSSRLLNGANKDKNLAIISTYEIADDSINELAGLIKMSGANLIANISLKNELFLGKNNAKIDSLADSLIPAGYALDVDNLSSVGRVSELLSFILRGNPGKKPIDFKYKQEMLQTFTKANLLDIKTFQDKIPDVVIIVTGKGLQENKNLNVSMATFTQEFKPEFNPLILAGGEGSAELGTVGIIRSDATLANKLTTVDDFQDYPGKLSTVLAVNNTFIKTYESIGGGKGAKILAPTVS